MVWATANGRKAIEKGWVKSHTPIYAKGLGRDGGRYGVMAGAAEV